MLKHVVSLLLLALVACSVPSCGEAPPHDEQPVLQQASLTCLAWNNGQCTWWQPELPPGASWCQYGDQVGPYEVMVWTNPYFQLSPWPYCMHVPAGNHRTGGNKILDLSVYGWAGPTFSIQSISFGTQAYGFTYTGDNWTGTQSSWQVGGGTASGLPWIQSMGVDY